MLERVAVFVDAGYFWVQVSHILYGEKHPREDISLDAKLMRESLIREVKREFPDHSLLRIYWYDSLKIDGQQSSQHKTICRLDDIKMRYGTLNSRGQQKGVDGLLIADLINLAQNGAIGSALIVSGRRRSGAGGQRGSNVRRQGASSGDKRTGCLVTYSC